LLPFFDFIIAVDGLVIEDDGPFFKDYLRTHNGQIISIDVYNTRIKIVRRIQITPNDQWGGAGLLGCSIMWESIEKAYLYSWHILDVAAGSNADKAGIHSHRDYIIGMESLGTLEAYCTMFSDEQDFERRLTQFTGAAEDPQNKRFRNFHVLFLVFDTVENNIREVLSSIPLGCEVGSGYMHTIPSSKGDQRLPVISKFADAQSSMRTPQTNSLGHGQVPYEAAPANPVAFASPPHRQNPSLQNGAASIQQAETVQPGLQTMNYPSMAPADPMSMPNMQMHAPAPIPQPVPQPVPNPYAGFPQGQAAVPDQASAIQGNFQGNYTLMQPQQ
jgi:hypothetical protein